MWIQPYIILLAYIFILSGIMGLMWGPSAFLMMFVPNIVWLIGLVIMTKDTFEG